MRGNLHARCGVGENLEIISKDYLSLFLNSARYDRIRTEEQGNIDETRLTLLKRIVDETGAQIVLSSSWRKHWDKDESLCDRIGRELNAVFAEHGMSVYDKTVCPASNDRAAEIRAWLKSRNDVEAFVILDDVPFGWGAELQEHLVRTNYAVGRGLEESHVLKSIEILSCGGAFETKE